MAPPAHADAWLLSRAAALALQRTHTERGWVLTICDQQRSGECLKQRAQCMDRVLLHAVLLFVIVIYLKGARNADEVSILHKRNARWQGAGIAGAR